ncbi:MAG: phosphonate ABC transporter, permease protein PhnE [Acidimicrobiaceae bacterium]|nr:phosphonate ABC transporter, permease protein PhnE [Acidimicrobiaceae bacterium]
MTVVGTPGTAIGIGQGERGSEHSSWSPNPPWTRARVVLIGSMVLGAFLLVLAWREIGMGVFPLFGGLGKIFSFIGRTLPPQYTGYASFGHTVSVSLQTVSMAVLGTVIAAALSVPVGFCAARNTTPHPAVRWLARGVITACRAVPDLVFAIVFVEALGIGVLPGVLALGVHSVGMLGKLFAEGIEQIEPRPREAVASTGAGPLQNLTTSVVPQVLPSFCSTSLYRLDINLRSSVVLGYVGAGGIGFALNAAMGALLFRQAVAIVLVIFVLIVVMEVVAALVRRSLIGLESPVSRTARPRRNVGDRIVNRIIGPPARGERIGFDRERVRPPWTKERALRYGFLAGALVAVGLSLWDTSINPVTFVTSLGRIFHTIGHYFPPDFSTARSGLIHGTLQSASVALVATTIGVAFAIPIGLLAARNVSDRWVYRGARLFLLVLRSVPELILAIVFVVAVGLGLVAGTFALIVGTVGFLSKLIADGIEEVPPLPREAVLSVGATRSQETATSVVAPSAPALVANSFYMLDVNFRSSTILGIVGGGGIGYLLQQSVQILAYRTTGAIILSTFVVVIIIEVITSAIRKHLI